MNRIEKLIKELCPDGVKYININNLLSDSVIETVSAPKKVFKKDYLVNGDYAIIDQGQSFIVGYTNDKGAIFEQEEYVVFGDHTESLKYVDFQFAQGADGIKVLKTNSNILNTKYLYYALNNFYIKKGAYKRHFTLLKETLIPLPPLDIQKEIAKILNEFTELEAAELETELESRKKQYEYYSNELLSFNEDIEYKELGKSLERTKGTAITAKRMNELNKGDAPIKIFAGGKTVAYVDYGDIPSKDVLTEESIVVKSRGFIGFEYIDKPFSHKNEFWSYHSTNPNISIKYVYYYLRSKEPYFQRIGQRMSKMPQLSIPDTDKYKIPIPPLSEQKRIVSILDKFDSLVNDISIGLPAELKARRKQYEYYRNKLLTFKEYGK